MPLRSIFSFLFLVFSLLVRAQVQWKNVDSAYGPLPSSIHIYFTDHKLDTAPFRAFYLIADLDDRSLNFTTDTTYKRRLTPSSFYEKNQQPLVVVNGTFFSFQTNFNLNLVMKEGKVLAHQAPSRQILKDSTRQVYVYGSAIGIDKKRNADIAWIIADSASENVFASQHPTNDAAVRVRKKFRVKNSGSVPFRQWKMETAIGGGPVLVQNGKMRITNDVERKFGGKAIKDKHPRTAMGYTNNGKLVIMAVEGRNPNASGATLLQMAELLLQLGCVEALNLDGGGSSCLLVNGKETITPSDKTGQRPVPGVFIIRN